MARSLADRREAAYRAQVGAGGGWARLTLSRFVAARWLLACWQARPRGWAPALALAPTCPGGHAGSQGGACQLSGGACRTGPGSHRGQRRQAVPPPVSPSHCLATARLSCCLPLLPPQTNTGQGLLPVRAGRRVGAGLHTGRGHVQVHGEERGLLGVGGGPLDWLIGASYTLTMPTCPPKALAGTGHCTCARPPAHPPAEPLLQNHPCRSKANPWCCPHSAPCVHPQNHSCSPSLYTKVLSVGGRPRLVFVARRAIAPGQELTYNYRWVDPGWMGTGGQAVCCWGGVGELCEGGQM